MNADGQDTLRGQPDLDLSGYGDSLFHSDAWTRSVEHAFGLDIDRFIAESEPAGSALYSVVDDLRGVRVVATPFSDFCDPNLSSQVGWTEFSAHLRSFDVPVTVRPFQNPHALADSSFERRSDLVWHGVDLRDGPDALFDRMVSKVRTKVRRAAKSGVEFRISSCPDDVALMHNMHVTLRKRKYRLLAQPLHFFTTLSEAFGEDMAVVVAELDGEPLAAMTFFFHGPIAYYKFSASVPNRVYANQALMMFGIRQAAERGAQLVDLGRSDIDQPGLLRFKEQFAPQSQRLTTLHWSPPDHANPQDRNAGATLGALTELLTDDRVPDDISTRAGELLYRYFA
ncbi:MAG: GNAT family N-acetyltransferase [Actinomycetota bacterium]